MRSIPQLLIAATTSGSGKTTFTTGLLRLLRRRGLKVQPYKCGPDYIDTKYHEFACGNKSINLDLFMSSREHIRDVYLSYSKDRDICVAEGVMGLYDGYDNMKGSSAEVAKAIGLPVLLFVNAKSTAYSVAATIHGFKNFYKEIDIRGVIFNNVASERHYELLLQACKDTSTECFGFVRRIKDLEVPSRHLGLTLDKRYDFDKYAETIADEIEKSVDIDRLLDSYKMDIKEKQSIISKDNTGIYKRISIAYDEAFNFLYEENVSKLKEIGTVTFFSPIADTKLPECDLLYIPGGYPEFHLKELSENRAMIEQVKHHIERGGKTIAECGGFMYLSQDIVGMDGKSYPLVGIFEHSATMENMKLSLGYRTIDIGGEILRGHEFHYSYLKDNDEKSRIREAKIYNAKGEETNTAIFRYKNTIAGYTHIYWGEKGIDTILNFLER